MNTSERSEETFILHKITIGTNIKITYSTWNDRMGDQVKRTMTEKENWSDDFSDTVQEIVLEYFNRHGLEINNVKVRRIRAKSLSLEGVKLKMTLGLMLHHELDEFEMKGLKLTGIQEQSLIDLVEEARKYVFETKRKQGELFTGSSSHVNFQMTVEEVA